MHGLDKSRDIVRRNGVVADIGGHDLGRPLGQVDHRDVGHRVIEAIGHAVSGMGVATGRAMMAGMGPLSILS